MLAGTSNNTMVLLALSVVLFDRLANYLINKLPETSSVASTDV